METANLTEKDSMTLNEMIKRKDNEIKILKTEIQTFTQQILSNKCCYDELLEDYTSCFTELSAQEQKNEK